MSYSIIFKTVIAKTDDGRIIHFDRSGCNNDDAGRKENEYNQTDVYCYEDVFNEDWTRKYSIDHEKIYEAFGNCDR